MGLSLEALPVRFEAGTVVLAFLTACHSGLYDWRTDPAQNSRQPQRYRADSDTQAHRFHGWPCTLCRGRVHRRIAVADPAPALLPEPVAFPPTLPLDTSAAPPAR